MACTLSEDIIDELEDLSEAISLMNEVNLDSDEIEDVEEARHELRKYLLQSSSGGDQAHNGSLRATNDHRTHPIQTLMEKNAKTRGVLEKLVEASQVLVKKLPETCRQDLLESHPNVDRDLPQVQENLKHNECIILVAGETGAGKSTLLNLLLGELAHELLPVAHMSSTSAICELKYGERGYIVVHGSSPDPYRIPLGEDAANTIANYVHQKGARESFEYSRVEIYWPCEWLKGGITIVDSPGVGENQQLTAMVKEYLPKATGFIYVINTPNAGGIDPAGLQDLIFSHLAMQKESGGEFDPRSAVFVGNKWDAVPRSDKKDVRDHVMAQLGKIWDGFTEDQVFFISVEQASQQLKDNMVAKDYVELLKGIERLVPVGLNTVLTKHYGVVMSVIDRCQFILNTCIYRGREKDEAVHKAIYEARRNLVQLQTQPDKLTSSLKKQTDEELTKALEQLHDHLNSRDVLERLSTWTTNDCKPLTYCKTVESLTEKMSAMVMKRIKTEVNDWDMENQIFQKIHNRIIVNFQKEFKSIESALKAIEENFVGEKAVRFSILEHFSSETVTEYSIRTKLIIGITAPIWVPVGVIVGLFALPALGISALWRNKKERKQLKVMKNKLEDLMAEMTRETVDELTRTHKLEEIISGRIQQLLTSITDIINNIPRFIEADTKMLDRMERELHTHISDLRHDYEPLCEEAVDLMNQLNCLYLSSFRNYAINYDDLVAQEYLGEGSFAEVYRAQWRQPNKKDIPVAFKLLKNSVSKENVNGIMLEEENLQKLQTENVVQFFGTSVRRDVINADDAHARPLFVMEYCSNTLDNIVYSPHYDAPARASDKMFQKAVMTAASFAFQISRGLMSIHMLGYLHRDLKPENILVTSENIVKIADLGLAKKIDDVQGTICGTPLYMAPEVWDEKKYDEKTDMYSFGMVLWELWYGECVDAMQQRSLKDFRARAFQKRRCPEGRLSAMMLRCWQEDPVHRPTAKEANLIISEEYWQKQ